MNLKRYYLVHQKLLIITLFVIVFIYSIISNIPTWVLGDTINHYSKGRLQLYNQSGSFWHGSGLLVASDSKLQSAPLLLISWNITLGLTKFADIKFSIGNTQIADIYLNKKGVNLDNLNLSLSISQVSQLYSFVRDLGLSGNINLSTDHIMVGKKFDGTFNIVLADVSSSISPVNPFGTYNIKLDAGTCSINVTSIPGSLLMLNGNGSVNGLSLNAQIDPAKKDKMLQFLTAMGMPKQDGSYDFKIF